MFTTRTALVSTTVVVLMGLTGSPATASPTREAPTSRGLAPAATSMYGVSLEALGGLTLAQYLCDHMALRVHPGV